MTNRDGNNGIYVMNADGSDQRRLTRSSGYETIAVLVAGRSEARLPAPPSTPRWAFFVMNADGTGGRKVTWAAPRR